MRDLHRTRSRPLIRDHLRYGSQIGAVDRTNVPKGGFQCNNAGAAVMARDVAASIVAGQWQRRRKLLEWGF